MVDLKETLKELCDRVLELDGNATKGWRAGRADMQSYTIGDIPFKNLYCDEIDEEREAAIVYGENSINDSQLFAEYRNLAPKLAKVVKELIWQRDFYMNQYICRESFNVDALKKELSEACDGKIEAILNE